MLLVDNSGVWKCSAFRSAEHTGVVPAHACIILNEAHLIITGSDILHCVTITGYEMKKVEGWAERRGVGEKREVRYINQYRETDRQTERDRERSERKRRIREKRRIDELGKESCEKEKGVRES